MTMPRSARPCTVAAHQVSYHLPGGAFYDTCGRAGAQVRMASVSPGPQVVSRSRHSRMFHATHTELPLGTVLTPASERPEDPSPYATVYAHNLDESWRADRVWMMATAADAADFTGTGYVYEVEAVDPVDLDDDGEDEDSLDFEMPSQIHAASARVIRQIDCFCRLSLMCEIHMSERRRQAFR